MIAFWSVATGVFEIVAAIRLRKEIQGEWCVGPERCPLVALRVDPGDLPRPGGPGARLVHRAFAIAFGVLLITLGFRLRSAGQTSEGIPPGVAGTPATLARPMGPAYRAPCVGKQAALPAGLPDESRTLRRA